MAGHSVPTRRIVLFTSALGSSLAPFMVSSMIVALPTIGRDFSADAVLLGWLTTAFFLAAATFLVPFGRFADIYGVKKVFSAGIVVYGATAFLCAIAPSILFLLAARFLTGIGAAMIFGTSIALLSLVFPEEERGVAIGINVTAMSAGFLLGFLAGGFLTSSVGWRGIFLLVIPVAILVTVIIRFMIPGECALARERKADTGGSVLYGVAIFLVIVGCTSLPSAAGAAMLIAGGVAGGLFIRYERRHENPLFDMSLFIENRVFARANLVVLLIWTGSFAITFLATLYLQDVKLFDPVVAGFILLSQTIVSIFTGPYAGRLSDRNSPALVASAGIVLMLSGFIPFLFLARDTPVSLIIIAFLVQGLGLILYQPALARLVVSSVDQERYGLASSMVESMRLIGITLSLAITVTIFSILLGGSTIKPETVPAFLSATRMIMVAFSVIILISLSICLTLRPGKNPGTG
jgi:MFS family permease